MDSIRWLRSASKVERLDLKPLGWERAHRCCPSLILKRLGVKPLHLLVMALSFGATAASAQYEVKSDAFGRLYRGTVPQSPTNIPPIKASEPQFAGVANTSGGTAARSTSTPLVLTTLYSSQIYYHSGTSTPNGVAILHTRSSFGGSFASGAPRYFFGDVILPPSTDDANAPLAANSGYWRPEPVRPGETFTHTDGLQDSGPHIAANLTLAYYYSPHAERVFASQAGRVAVTWVTRVPVASGSDLRLRYRYRDETFAVSAATQKPTRSIFWTERNFNGPIVSIPAGNIEEVKAVYNATFTEHVVAEYKGIGDTTPATGPAAETRTLWFDRVGGNGQLHAYNLEGRILLEYLGKLKSGSTTVHTFLGADIVEVTRVATTVNASVALGERITPRDADNRLLPLDNGPAWLASPVNTAAPDAQTFYGTSARPDGSLVYYAERENSNPDRVQFYWLDQKSPAISGDAAGSAVALYWPQARNAYAIRWPDALSAYAHNTVAAASTVTGVQFGTGSLPQIVFQDDGAQTEGAIDPLNQRLVVNLPAAGDGVNRTLIKFSSGNDVWYVRLYTQIDGRQDFQQPDGGAAFTGPAVVGQRLAPPSADYQAGGYVVTAAGSSDAIDWGAYADPFAAGMDAANRGGIIPVNAPPGPSPLRVWWFRAVVPPSAGFQPFYVPSKIGTYTISYPSNPPQIVLASNAGSGDLSPSELAGTLYVQNDRTVRGFNPNEEHALMLNGRIYALRDDLNNVGTDPAAYTSEPYALLRYISPTDGRPAMSAFKIVRETDTVKFDYPVTAGTIVQGPMPLPVLPQPLDAAGLTRNVESAGTADSAHQGPTHYTSFTFADRKGFHWVYRGPHASATPSFKMQFYYTMRAGFFVPGLASQPPVGAILPYLRPIASGAPVGDPVSGNSLAVVYRPVWPDSAPSLRVAETLTLPKFGLPDVISQTSANVLYQQSIAVNGATKPSVVLHDPTREKVFALGSAGQLAALPTSVLTSATGGKVYFQRLPPHLQSRFYYDPARGTKGSLVLLGKFVDEIAGDDYLQLNVLSGADKATIEALPSANDAARNQWLEAVSLLVTKVETFVEDPAKAGSFKSDGSPVTVGPTTLAAIGNSDTAVNDYALTATGAGSGWVTMAFGNGRAFTPTGEPVAVKVFKVAPQLYTGDLKVLLSQNPLDEQVTLRHSGDFAAVPENYEFEWRYSPPSESGAPLISEFAMTSRLGTSWQLVQSPAGTLPTAAEYNAASTVSLPRTVQILTAGSLVGTAKPGLVVRSVAGVDFSAGVPAEIVFSATTSDLTGFVVYVNGVAATAFQAPASFANATAASGLVPATVTPAALARQFRIDPSYFQQAVNRIEVALYSSADAGTSSGIDFRLHGSTETDKVDIEDSPWQTPNGTLANEVIVGGSPGNPLGTPILILTDNYFTMRYRPRIGRGNILAPGSDQAAVGWSRWMTPKLVEGWVKRVLAGINPFNQRIGDLYNNAVNTDVSILTQAGKRWEGDVALSLENINNFGLIEIYETVLNRGKSLSIDSGYDNSAANNALLLAAGYLNDLYTILGHEAYADAANSTISLDDSTTITEVNTARFSFEGQVSSVLDEELALLRGRDDLLSPGVTVSPAYNRLYWNYTRGIVSGEALYAVNYNIREKAGSPTANGVLDAADAQRLYPQGHGDAYGHYLTALTGYYRLLTNPKFTWVPRSEEVTVLGQAVAVDYFDERKFADAAANLARTAQQIVALTHRQNYKDDPAAGWQHFRDGKANSSTGITRQWGLDEWTSRAAQGSYYHWIVGSALVPDKDINPNHTGVQVIDRTTIPSLRELPAAGEGFQNTMDAANAHLNPLGLSPGAIAFDISAADLKAGKAHYEQIHERALRAVLNAKGAFDQAAKMTRLLRSQDNQLESTNAAIVDQERAFVKQLIEIYGTPYDGSIGVGKTYAQGYAGPDTAEFFVIDRPTDFVSSAVPISMQLRVPLEVATFTGFDVESIKNAYDGAAKTVVKTLTVQPNQMVQFADVWRSGGPSLGARSVTGTLQQALLDMHQAYVALLGGADKVRAKQEQFQRRYQLYLELLSSHQQAAVAQSSADDRIADLAATQKELRTAAFRMQVSADFIGNLASSFAEFLPGVSGLDNDITSTARGAVLFAGAQAANILSTVAAVKGAEADKIDLDTADTQAEVDGTIAALGFSYQQAQVAYEYELIYRELVHHHLEIDQLATNLQRTNERVRNVLATGIRLLEDRTTFRQRAAAVIQGYRTKDVTFRTFRNEALEQYRSLFDLGARYTYLAAKSYDYETGLLGSTAGQEVVNSIVAARALGDLSGGMPQATVSTTGDSGLAGTMARLQADWSVAKGRLGINNPDQNGTLFSLRRELFRLMDDPAVTDDDAQWQQTLEQHVLSNVLADPDVAALCRNLRKSDGSAVPGIVIPFRTTIQAGQNFFGLPLADGDHTFSISNFSTKIYSVGMVFRGYVGMDPYQPGNTTPTVVFGSTPNALSATPYAYLIPTGVDYMRAPPLGDTDQVRGWTVADQALPLPFNLGATAFSTTQFYNANGTLSEAPWVLRKHQAFRPVSDPTFFYSSIPAEFTNSRLVGRSVWNGGWKIVIPANTLLGSEQEGLNRFVASVKDIELFLRTYSHSGN